MSQNVVSKNIKLKRNAASPTAEQMNKSRGPEGDGLKWEKWGEGWALPVNKEATFICLLAVILL